MHCLYTSMRKYLERSERSCVLQILNAVCQQKGNDSFLIFMLTTSTFMWKIFYGKWFLIGKHIALVQEVQELWLWSAVRAADPDPPVFIDADPDKGSSLNNFVQPPPYMWPPYMGPEGRCAPSLSWAFWSRRNSLVAVRSDTFFSSSITRCRRWPFSSYTWHT